MATDEAKAVDALLFAPEDADAIFVELGTLRVVLDNDPLSFGPKRLNTKVAEVRRALDRCERIFLDVSQRMYSTRRALRVSMTELELNRKSLFANDPETRAGRSVADREAIATGKLIKDVRRMHELEMSSEDLEAVLTVVKSKRADLKDTEGRLKDQVRLCQEEMGLGQRWGSRLPDAECTVDLSKGRPATSDAEDVAGLIRLVDEEVHLARASGEWEDVPEVALPIEEMSPEESLPEPILNRAPKAPVAPLPVAEPLAPIVDLEPEPEPVTEALPGEEMVEATTATAEVILPGTTTSTDVSGFLEVMSLGTPAPKKVTTEPSRLAAAAAMDGDALLDFLKDFESTT